MEEDKEQTDNLMKYQQNAVRVDLTQESQERFEAINQASTK